MKQNDQNKPDILAYLRGELSAEDRAAIENLMAQDTEFAADVRCGVSKDFAGHTKGKCNGGNDI